MGVISISVFPNLRISMHMAPLVSAPSAVHALHPPSGHDDPWRYLLLKYPYRGYERQTALLLHCFERIWIGIDHDREGR
jgi:hypothetical protein